MKPTMIKMVISFFCVFPIAVNAGDRSKLAADDPAFGWVVIDDDDNTTQTTSTSSTSPTSALASASVVTTPPSPATPDSTTSTRSIQLAAYIAAPTPLVQVPIGVHPAEPVPASPLATASNFTASASFSSTSSPRHTRTAAAAVAPEASTAYAFNITKPGVSTSQVMACWRSLLTACCCSHTTRPSKKA